MFRSTELATIPDSLTFECINSISLTSILLIEMLPSLMLNQILDNDVLNHWMSCKNNSDQLYLDSDNSFIVIYQYISSFPKHTSKVVEV